YSAAWGVNSRRLAMVAEVPSGNCTVVVRSASRWAITSLSGRGSVSGKPDPASGLTGTRCSTVPDSGRGAVTKVVGGRGGAAAGAAEPVAGAASAGATLPPPLPPAVVPGASLPALPLLALPLPAPSLPAAGLSSNRLPVSALASAA